MSEYSQLLDVLPARCEQAAKRTKGSEADSDADLRRRPSYQLGVWTMGLQCLNMKRASLD